jgi:hypothetical protein
VKETETIKKARAEAKANMEDVVGSIRKIADKHQIRIVGSIEDHLKKNQKMDNFDKVIRYRSTVDVMIGNLKKKIQTADIPEEEKADILQSLNEAKEEIQKVYRRFQLVF